MAQNTRWFQFRDTNSGGFYKTEHKVIWIQARTEDSAADRFEGIIGRNPYGIACECCGPNYDIWDDNVIDTPRSGFRVDIQGHVIE